MTIRCRNMSTCSLFTPKLDVAGASHAHPWNPSQVDYVTGYFNFG